MAHEELLLMQNNFNRSFDEIFILESIIKLTKDFCLERENISEYYNLTSKEKLNLSEERNNYINMLSLALDRVNNLKQINLKLENNIGNLKQYTNYGSRKVTT